MEVVEGQPIKKIKFFRIPQSLYWRPSADQKARGLWVRDWVTTEKSRKLNTIAVGCMHSKPWISHALSVTKTLTNQVC